MDKGKGMTGEVFKILGQSPAPPQPRKGPFYDPAPRQNCEALDIIVAFDNLDFNQLSGFGQRFFKERPAVSTIRPQQPQPGEFIKFLQEQRATISVLDIRRMNDRQDQQADRVDQDMPLFPLDLFPRIIAIRINTGPPFSVLLTL